MTHIRPLSRRSTDFGLGSGFPQVQRYNPPLTTGNSRLSHSMTDKNTIKCSSIFSYRSSPGMNGLKAELYIVEEEADTQ